MHAGKSRRATTTSSGNPAQPMLGNLPQLGTLLHAHSSAKMDIDAQAQEKI